MKSGSPFFIGVALLIFLGGVYAMWSSLNEGVLNMRYARVDRLEYPIWFWLSFAVVGVGSAFFLVAGGMSVIKMIRGSQQER